MRLLLRRALQGAGAAGLVVALSSGPVSAGVGTRLANGDSDTSGKCMSITNTGRGTNVEMEPCTTNAHQGWAFKKPFSNSSWAQIVSQDADARGRCITAHAEGVRVTMDRCAAPTPDLPQGLYAQQSWLIVTVSGNWFQLWNLGVPAIDGVPQCLDVRDNGESNVVQTWQCGPDAGPNVKGNQMWKFF